MEIQVEEGVKEFSELRTSISREQLPQTVEEGKKKAISLDPKSDDFDIQAFFEDSVRSDEGKVKIKKLGVIFKNLTVVGQGADATSITDNLSIFKYLWPGNW